MKLFQMWLLVFFAVLLSFGSIGYTQEIPANENNGTQIRVYEVIAEVKQDGFIDHRVSFSVENPEQNFRHVIFSKIDNFRYETSSKAFCTSQSLVFGTQINCEFESVPESALITFFFTSQDSTKKQSGVWFYQSDYKTLYPVVSATVSVKLPEGALLAQESDISPYSPTNGETRSDGRRIIVIWQRADIGAGESFLFSILYENVATVPTELFYMALAIVAAIGVGVLVYLFHKRKTQTKNGATQVLEVLTPEEKKVIEIIRANKGRVVQKRVVQETDFSKAKVSRIVKNLQTRNIISVEPSGRENMLILRTGIVPEEEIHSKIEPTTEEKNKTPDSPSSEPKSS